MPASTTGSKTVTKDLAPHLTAATLTALLTKPIESLTIADLRTLEDAVKRTSKGHDPQTTIGALLA